MFPSKSDKDGSIISEETVSFILSGNRTVALGISEDMINSCIDTAKATTSGKRTLDS
jgi:hypothetical protein